MLSSILATPARILPFQMYFMRILNLGQGERQSLVWNVFGNIFLSNDNNEELS